LAKALELVQEWFMRMTGSSTQQPAQDKTVFTDMILKAIPGYKVRTGYQPNTGGDLATDGTRFWVTQGNTTVNFVERFYASADVTRANTPGNVVAGGGLTYLASPGGLGTSQMGASPNVRKLGDSFTITLTLEATQAVTGVTPTALQITGGAATITGPSPASADLTANTPQVFTWTVTPGSVGEYIFSAGASSATVNFETATSNSVLVSPDGQRSVC
jgi:hypothetical protein